MLESNLPPTTPQYIEMRHLNVEPYRHDRVELAVEFTFNGEDSGIPLKWERLTPGRLYLVDHPVLGSYIPSKVISRAGMLTFIYYVNPDLPDAIRPFADGQCYVWVVEWRADMQLRYPAEARVFIDQVIDARNGNIYTVFITSTGEFAKLVPGPEEVKRAIELEGDLAIYTSNGEV